MDRIQFEKLVEEGVSKIPRRFLKKLNNVAIVVEDQPNLHQRKAAQLRGDMLLLGLYEGVPLTKRGQEPYRLPDKISIFQKSIEAIAVDEKDMRQIVIDTVWHEVAHYFGIDEPKVQSLAEKRRHQ